MRFVCKRYVFYFATKVIEMVQGRTREEEREEDKEDFLCMCVLVIKQSTRIQSCAPHDHRTSYFNEKSMKKIESQQVGNK